MLTFSKDFLTVKTFKITITKNIEEFTKICESIKFQKVNSILKPSNEIDLYKLEFKNQLLRGQLIENLLMYKILLKNFDKTIFKLEGRLRTKQNIFKISSSEGIKRLLERMDRKHILFDIFLGRLLFNHPDGFNPREILFKGEKLFKAKNRCIIKPSIQYCFIDVIVDDTLIDIKTDVNSKSLRKYLKQTFIQSVMFSSFLKTQKKYTDYLTVNEINLINQEIKHIAIYFWRTNEFFKYNLLDLTSTNKYKKLVNIYTVLQKTHSRELREIMWKLILKS